MKCLDIVFCQINCPLQQHGGAMITEQHAGVCVGLPQSKDMLVGLTDRSRVSGCKREWSPTQGVHWNRLQLSHSPNS